MAVALALSILSVVAGALLAMAPRVRAIGLGPIRTFALAAAGVAVFGHLLPEAVDGLGAIAFVAFAGALSAPWLIERLGHRWLGDHHHEDAHVAETGSATHAHGAASRWAAEISFAALLLHQVGDGVALHHYAAADEPSLDAALALSLHTVPVAAVVVLRFSRGPSRRAGLLRALWLAVATLVGLALGATVVSHWLETAGPWTAAIVSGLLLHVLGHDLGRDAPGSTRARVLELAGLVAGLAIAYAALRLGAGEHAHGDGHAHGDALSSLTNVGHAMAELGVAIAPWTLGAIVLSASWAASRRQDAHVAPIEPSGMWGRVMASARTSFLAPGARELAPMTVLLTIALLGWRLAIARVVGALIALLTLHAIVRVETARPEHVAPGGADARPRARPSSSSGRFAIAAGRTVHECAPRLVLGIVIAGVVSGVVGPDAFDATSTEGVLLTMLAMLAVVVQPDAAAATIVAAAFASRGWSVGLAAACALVAGMRPRRAWGGTVGSLRAVAAHGTAVAVGGAVVLGLDRLSPSTQRWPHDPTSAPWMIAPAAVLALLVGWQLYRCGLRAWIATVTGTEHRHEPTTRFERDEHHAHHAHHAPHKHHAPAHHAHHAPHTHDAPAHHAPHTHDAPAHHAPHTSRTHAPHDDAHAAHDDAHAAQGDAHAPDDARAPERHEPTDGS